MTFGFLEVTFGQKQPRSSIDVSTVWQHDLRRRAPTSAYDTGRDSSRKLHWPAQTPFAADERRRSANDS